MSRVTEYYRIESLQPFGTASFWDIHGSTRVLPTLKEAQDELAWQKMVNPMNTKFRIIRMVKEIVE